MMSCDSGSLVDPSYLVARDFNLQQDEVVSTC